MGQELYTDGNHWIVDHQDNKYFCSGYLVPFSKKKLSLLESCERTNRRKIVIRIYIPIKQASFNSREQENVSMRSIHPPYINIIIL